MDTISLTLDLFPRGLDREGDWVGRCPRCPRPLTLHQPDPDRPDRLVGDCPGCRNWFLIDTDGGLMVRLPGDDELRAIQPPPRP